MEYQVYKVNLSKSQKQKLKEAVERKTEVTLRLDNKNLQGNDGIAITKTQLNRINKAINGKKGIDLKLSKTQIAYNKRVQGGILPFLAIPALIAAGKAAAAAAATGAVGAAAAHGVKKVLGDGLYLKRGG